MRVEWRPKHVDGGSWAICCGRIRGEVVWYEEPSDMCRFGRVVDIRSQSFVDSHPPGVPAQSVGMPGRRTEGRAVEQAHCRERVLNWGSFTVGVRMTAPRHRRDRHGEGGRCGALRPPDADNSQARSRFGSRINSPFRTGHHKAPGQTPSSGQRSRPTITLARPQRAKHHGQIAVLVTKLRGSERT